jgi:DNA-binding NarL/FixJ family response regulator
MFAQGSVASAAPRLLEFGDEQLALGPGAPSGGVRSRLVADAGGQSAGYRPHLARPGSRARTLMLTTHDLDEYVYRAMRAGASGFLLKDASRDQLATAVRTVAAGEALLAPSVTRRLIEDFCRRPSPDGAAADAARQLTGRALEIVKLVAKGLSNAEIAARLYLSETGIVRPGGSS